MGEPTDRIKELNKTYSWNIILKSLCNNILELDIISDLEFGTILTWLELQKCENEIEHIRYEQNKNKK